MRLKRSDPELATNASFTTRAASSRSVLGVEGPWNTGSDLRLQAGGEARGAEQRQSLRLQGRRCLRRSSPVELQKGAFEANHRHEMEIDVRLSRGGFGRALPRGSLHIVGQRAAIASMLNRALLPRATPIECLPRDWPEYQAHLQGALPETWLAPQESPPWWLRRIAPKTIPQLPTWM